MQTREDGARIDHRPQRDDLLRFAAWSAHQRHDDRAKDEWDDDHIQLAKRTECSSGRQEGECEPDDIDHESGKRCEFSAPATIQITADAADADGTVTRLDFNAGNQFLNTKNSSPWTYTWRTFRPGRTH